MKEYIMDKIVVVTSTFSSKEDAEQMARKLLEKNLAACVQISSAIQSFYWWKGDIEQSDEYILTVKTRTGLYEEVERFLKKFHQYETPEIIGQIIDYVDSDYQQWLFDETSAAS